MELPRHLADLDADTGVINLTAQFFTVQLSFWVAQPCPDFLVMEPPRHLADLGADAGVINLTMQFFTVHVLRWVAQTCQDFLVMKLPRHLADLAADAGVSNLKLQFFTVHCRSGLPRRARTSGGWSCRGTSPTSVPMRA